MMLAFGRRMFAETDLRLLSKFVVNFGIKGIRSVEIYKKRLKRGEYFPPFLFISVISSCQLRCQGCWVDVEAPSQKISLEDMNKLLNDAKAHGNSYFGILGGEPFLHPQLLDIFAAHPDCYFQVFTNGQLITNEVARELRKIGNVTPLISIEGTEVVSDERRGRLRVLSKSLEGIENCRRNKLITGVATSVCQSNIEELVDEGWLRRLIAMGVHYAWFHTYRVVGPNPHPELALRPEQVLRVRRFVVEMRSKLPIAIVDAYWDDKGEALCPMATGVSHHISPYGDLEPCPIIQFARETIHDNPSIYDTFNNSAFLRDFRQTAAKATRGCVVLERPDLVRDLVARHQGRDTTQRGTALAEMENLLPRNSQHNPGNEVPEDNWMYRFAKKHWFFGFGAYT
ncbi:MAG TPA: radical SAM/SPASM domain-containing protein [Bryobacteraceae bacterium]|nr:radical SAM/SPASM domain-containing protein [Bryobacteraceae bacterium]